MKKLLLGVAILFWPMSAVAQSSEELCRTTSPFENPSAAIRACRHALIESPALKDDAEIHRNLGMAAREVGEFDQSIVAFETALALEYDTQTLRMLAWSHRENDDLVKAEELYTRGLAEEDHWQGWLSRCVVRGDLENWAGAISDCRAAQERDPENDDVYFFLARSLSFGELYEESFAVATEGAALFPEQARFYTELAWAARLTGQGEFGLKVAKDALQRFPEDAGLLHFLSSN